LPYFREAKVGAASHHRSNPAVKLLTPPVNVQDISSAENEDRGVGTVNEVPDDVIDVSTTIETIILDSAEEQKDEDDKEEKLR
jgi:hypothetical protein